MEADSFICCNSCPCVICMKCIDTSTYSHKTILSQDITFRYIICHRELIYQNPAGTFYFVSPFISYLFVSNSRLVFNTFLLIIAALELSMWDQILSALVFIFISHVSTSIQPVVCLSWCISFWSSTFYIRVRLW